MRLALRDDDTNFFTTPRELEDCYGTIWQTVPPTLCLISKVKGNWLDWVHRIYREKQNTDWNAWKADDTIHPIEGNEALIDFLKEGLRSRKLDVGFHAKYHRNEDAQLPGEVQNNYVRGAEFFTSRDLKQYISEEVKALNDLLGYKISVFTPPQNMLSPAGYKSVISAGLNICGGGISFLQKQKNTKGLSNLWKQMKFKLAHPGKDYPFVLHFSKHSEAPHHYPLQPNTQLSTLIQKFDEVKSFDGDFVLSTHYVEMHYPMTYNSRKKMKDVLQDFLEYTARFNVSYVTLSDLLGTKISNPSFK